MSAPVLTIQTLRDFVKRRTRGRWDVMLRNDGGISVYGPRCVGRVLESRVVDRHVLRRDWSALMNALDALMVEGVQDQPTWADYEQGVVL